MKPTRNVKVISDAWRRLAQTTHPDKGGNADSFAEVRAAYKQALLLAPNVIEVKRPDRKLSFKLTLSASDVINDTDRQVEFYDHLGQIITIWVTIPAWKMEWGTTQMLRLQSIPVSDSTTVTLDIICDLCNDLLTITKSGLVLEPEVLAKDAIDQHQISFEWMGTQTITIDKHGQGLLYSAGYYMEDGTRGNILVVPKYVFN